MKNRCYQSFINAIVAALLLFSLPAYAGETLNKQQVIQLIADTTVDAYYITQGQQHESLTARVNLKYVFHMGGDAERTTYRAKAAKGNVIEKGSWVLNKKNRLCLRFLPENKMRCWRMERSPEGEYQLVGKQRTIIIEKITPN